MAPKNVLKVYGMENPKRFKPRISKKGLAINSPTNTIIAKASAPPMPSFFNKLVKSFIYLVQKYG